MSELTDDFYMMVQRAGDSRGQGQRGYIKLSRSSGSWGGYDLEGISSSAVSEGMTPAMADRQDDEFFIMKPYAKVHVKFPNGYPEIEVLNTPKLNFFETLREYMQVRIDQWKHRKEIIEAREESKSWADQVLNR